jgi:hypothetical protein
MRIDKKMYKIYCSGCSVVIFGTMWSMQYIYLAQFFWKFHISEILRNLILVQTSLTAIQLYLEAQFSECSDQRMGWTNYEFRFNS